jgi:protease YdgD
LRARVAALAWATLLPLGPGHAAPDETRVLPEARSGPAIGQAWPYAAVARVDVTGPPGIRECTGTLVGPRLLVTAAHCVVGLRGPAGGGIRVTFGPAASPWSTLVGHVRIAPGFRPSPTWKMVARDWALLTLSRSPDSRPVPMSRLDAGSLEVAARSMDVVRAGYGSGTRDVLTVHRGCAVQAVAGEPGLVLHECYSSPGNSGSPLFLVSGARVELVALHTAVGPHPWRDARDGTSSAMWVGGGPAARAFASPDR